MTHFSEAMVRNLAWRGSRSREPRQRLWIGAPHMRRHGLSVAPTMRAADRGRRYRPSPAHVSGVVSGMGRTRVLRRLLALASATLVVSASAGCGNTDSWVDSVAAQGWSAQYADAANTSYTSTAGSATLQLSWSRSVKGSLDAGAALGGGSYLAVNGQTAGGCSLMVWENDNNGRQRWCTRMVLGGGFASPLFDQFDNLYIGQPGLMLSYPPTQWVRWREHVIGMPTTTRFLGWRPTAGGDPPRAGAGVRLPPRRRHRHPDWTSSRASTPRMPPAASTTASRHCRCARSRPRRRSRRRANIDRASACGSPTRRPRCWSACSTTPGRRR